MLRDREIRDERQSSAAHQKTFLHLHQLNAVRAH
jgi:hypothetical protein